MRFPDTCVGESCCVGKPLFEKESLGIVLSYIDQF